MRAFILAAAAAAAAAVRVEITSPKPGNAPVTKASAYDAQVTLSIEAADGSLTPSGWSTRKEGGGDGRPFSFTPGVNLSALRARGGAAGGAAERAR
jgi:hypothetical protein